MRSPYWGGDDVARNDDEGRIIFGNAGNDSIVGGAGNDTLAAGRDNDVLDGSSGDNILFGNLGEDTVTGGAGNDSLFGGQGDDVVIGGLGNDLLSGDRGRDTLTGGDGIDHFSLAASAEIGEDVIVDFQDGVVDTPAVKSKIITGDSCFMTVCLAPEHFCPETPS
ncbi:MAG: Hemolysin-type calcium-binding repeat (2 copies), partial [Phormidium sp. OSCR]